MEELVNGGEGEEQSPKSVSHTYQELVDIWGVSKPAPKMMSADPPKECSNVGQR